ncbi:hypothetical protein QU593_10195 [Rossellomorea marisflavi]|uniref:hypothetical protein n=1 Tax=Rossellomorea marisflavi TaxID=189381 RepID=UPI0025B1EE3F|nr:hypothetical protein [Rossellomorea marisflavi]WJV20775.1 hypothetical protein QU593_10195 [Rossellomorea marisflavi]
MKTLGFGVFTLFGRILFKGGEKEFQERISDSGIARAYLTIVGNDGEVHTVDVEDFNIDLEDWEEIKGKAAK